MRLLIRSLPIETSLRPAAINQQSPPQSRHHLIKDLADQGPEQIACFLERIDQILKHRNQPRLSLITVLATSNPLHTEPRARSLFDFLGITVDDDHGYGVMLSTYLHDLERDRLEADPLNRTTSGCQALGRRLMESLFRPTACNGEAPPFPGTAPVFVFPASRRTGTSPTDVYMESLGFTVRHRPSQDGHPALRLYRHTSEHRPFGTRTVDRAIVAAGIACVEMTDHRRPGSATCLRPFDRTRMDVHAQKLTALTTHAWLRAELPPESIPSEREIIV